MKRQTTLPATTIVTLAFGTLTRGQKHHEAKKLGKAIDQIDANMKVKMPGNVITPQQLKSLQASGQVTSSPSTINAQGRRGRHKADRARTTTSTAGSALKMSEMKIADYNWGGLPLKLVYGNGQQVATHLGTLQNKTAIAMVAIDAVKTYADGKYPWAAALYVDAFEGNFENQKQALPQQFVQGIIDNLNGKSVMKHVSLLNFITKFGNGVNYANGSASLKGQPCVRRFLSALSASIFGKGCNVQGTFGTEQTNTVFFLGEAGPRNGYQWVGENFTYIASAFPKKATHHTVGPDCIIEFEAGSNTFKALNASQMWTAAHEGLAPEFTTVKIDEKLDGKIVDLSVVTTTQSHGYVAIATIEGGKNGYVPFTLDLSGSQVALKAISGIGVPAEVSKNLGWIGRISERGVTMIGNVQGEAAIARLPVSYMPTELKGMVHKLYQTTAIAA